MRDITIDQDLCIQCGACIALCKSAKVYAEVERVATAVAPENCWLCGHCVAACPTDAIDHAAFPLDECPSLDGMSLPSLDGLVGAFRARRSCRVFRDEPVPRSVVQELVGLSRYVPSGNNAQAIDWLAIDDRERIAGLSADCAAVLARSAELLRKRWLRPALRLALGSETVRKGLASADALDRLAKRRAAGEDPIFHDAPVLLLAHVLKGDYFGRDHAVYAACNLMLCAQRLGMGTCQIGYFQIALDRSKQLRQSLGLAMDRQAEVTLVLGYPVFEFQRAVPRRQPELMWDARPEP